MKRQTLLLMLMLLLLLGVFTGCKQLESQEEELYEQVKEEDMIDNAPVPGGEVILPLSYIDTLNPLKSKNRSYYYFSKLIYESLFDYNENGELEPVLVEHYSVSNDGYQISLTLKNDIYWHDGAPLTAEDVDMSLTALKGLDSENGYVTMLKGLTGAGNDFDQQTVFTVKAFDSRNVDIKFNKPYINGLEILTTPILPSHLLSEGRVFNEVDFKPIGTGPYQMFQYREGREIILKSNDRYHGKVPMIKMIRGKIFSDEDTALTAFETGQIDMSIALNSDWDKYTKNSRIRIFEYPTNEVEMLAMNMDSPKFQGDTGKALRQAIYLSVNRQTIIDRVYLGRADEPRWLLNPNDSEAAFLPETNPYDVNRAKSILEEAGLVDSDGDGFREWLDGNPIKLSILTNVTNRDRNLMARYVANDLRAIGIDAKVAGSGHLQAQTVVESDKAQDFQQTKAAMGSGNYEIAIYGMQLTSITDLTQFLSKSAIDGTNNVARYKSEEVDELAKGTKIRLGALKEDAELEGETTEEEIEEGLSTIVLGGDIMAERDLTDLSSETGLRIDQDLLAELRQEARDKVSKLYAACEDDPAYVALLYKKGALLVDHHVYGESTPTYTNIYKNIGDLYIPLSLQ